MFAVGSGEKQYRSCPIKKNVNLAHLKRISFFSALFRLPLVDNFTSLGTCYWVSDKDMMEAGER